jgi:hypothetical protein
MLDSEIWNDVQEADINTKCWSDWIYLPDTKAYILSNEKGIALKFVTDEKPYVKYYNNNDNVNRDSCVEFFFNPNYENDKRYFNFEINAAGILSVGIGECEYNRDKIYCADYKIFDIETFVSNEGWKLKIFIPFEFIKKYFNKISKTIKGNLYKCGDRTPNPHYGVWSPILTSKPEFHKPEYFGDFILENDLL